jgi:hypothetical protein
MLRPYGEFVISSAARNLSSSRRAAKPEMKCRERFLLSVEMTDERKDCFAPFVVFVVI